jgi:hypothetical protein
MRYDYSLIPWVAANNNYMIELVNVMSLGSSPTKRFSSSIRMVNHGVWCLCWWRSFLATDMKVTVPTGGVGVLWLDPFRSFKSVVPVCPSRRIDHSCSVWTLGWWLVPLFTCSREGGWVDRTHGLGVEPCTCHVTLACMVPAPTSTIARELTCSCVSSARPCILALLFVPATRGWHGLLLNLFCLGSDP